MSQKRQENKRDPVKAHNSHSQQSIKLELQLQQA